MTNRGWALILPAMILTRRKLLGAMALILVTAGVVTGGLALAQDAGDTEDPTTYPVEGDAADELMVPGPNGSEPVLDPPEADRPANHLSGEVSEGAIEDCYALEGRGDIACRALVAAGEGRLEPGDYTDEELQQAVERAEQAGAE